VFSVEKYWTTNTLNYPVNKHDINITIGLKMELLTGLYVSTVHSVLYIH